MNFYKRYPIKYVTYYKRKENMEAIAVLVIILIYATSTLG